jgi:hypothetical protein
MANVTREYTLIQVLLSEQPHTGWLPNDLGIAYRNCPYWDETQDEEVDDWKFSSADLERWVSAEDHGGTLWWCYHTFSEHHDIVAKGPSLSEVVRLVTEDVLPALEFGPHDADMFYPKSERLSVTRVRLCCPA